jgi:hypothetical protein
MSGPRRRMKSDVSDFASMNPREVRYVANRLYQAQGACFSLNKDLFRRQTGSGSLLQSV